MKILNIISTGYKNGGAEYSIIETKDYFEKKGHSVRVLSSSFNPTNYKFNDYEFSYINPKNPFKIVFNLFNPYAYFKLKKILMEYNPDVVHLHNMDLVSPSVLFLLKKYPTVMTLHGPETFIDELLIWCLKDSHFKSGHVAKGELNIIGRLHYYYHAYLQKPMYNLGFKNVDIFISLSVYMANIFISKTNKLIKMNNYIKILQFKKIKNYNKLLYVGRMAQEKGINYLIDAMPAILRVHPQVTLTIIGNGEYKNKLQKLVDKMRLNNNIFFVDAVDQPELQKFYEDSTMLIMPSIWPETFGKVGVEAMSVGRPVIASNVGGISEWLDNEKVGYLVTPKDSREISRKVIFLLKNRDLLHKMSSNARKKAEKYSVSRYVEEIIDIYLKLINKYKRNIKL